MTHALYQLLPGPEATELCAGLGMRRGGPLGGVLAAMGFVLPGVVLMFTVLLHEQLERWMAQRSLHALLDGVMLGGWGWCPSVSCGACLRGGRCRRW